MWTLNTQFGEVYTYTEFLLRRASAGRDDSYCKKWCKLRRKLRSMPKKYGVVLLEDVPGRAAEAGTLQGEEEESSNLQRNRSTRLCDRCRVRVVDDVR